LGLPTKHAALEQSKAWRDRAQTGPSMRSANASADKRWIMRRRRGLGSPSLTSSDALLKESFEYREGIFISLGIMGDNDEVSTNGRAALLGTEQQRTQLPDDVSRTGVGSSG